MSFSFQIGSRKTKWEKDYCDEDIGLGKEDIPGGSVGEESICNVEDLGLIPGLGQSPEEGNGYPLHILAWRIPWTV